MQNLELGSKVISYSIRKSLRAKYVSISIGADGVKIVAPVSMEDAEIIHLVENKREWIFNKFDSYSCRLTQKRLVREYISGEKLLFMGEDYPLRLLDHDGQYNSVNLKDDQIQVAINKDIPQEKKREAIRKIIEQWYIARAKELIHERLELFADKISVHVNTVRFKNQKTRWGSCSQKGNLNFNWKLVMAPTHIIDYVVVHELCHLRHMNHSKEFWLLVASHISDYKVRRNWLKENGINMTL
ncbi:MAG TPA: SprT family zinc-dependent metalloprotease [Desulfosporosinus sp.]